MDINLQVLDKSRNGHTDSVVCLVSHCDEKGNKFIYSGGYDSTIRKWNDKDECVQVLDESRGGHIDEVYCLVSHYDENGNKFIYSGSQDKSIRKWGEYWPCHYTSLSTSQKEKIKNWKDFKCNIQKDLKFLFERELLNTRDFPR